MQNSGIVVPLMFNDVNTANQYASGSISADLYGFDQYPQGSSISLTNLSSYC